jgi:antitoxin (DNA-binding transcriptional repressor) of toxin-antitoxin stability system
MIRYVSVKEAPAQLVELIKTLPPGDEIVLTDGARAVARISPTTEPLPPRQPGTLKGKLRIIDDNDDWIAEHFKDYM